jgi:N-acetylmuramoyl-L-alanine amidase
MKLFRYFKRLPLIMALLFAVCSEMFAQDGITIDSLQVMSSKQRGFIPSAQFKSVQFISLRGLSAFVGADVFENGALKKLEVKYPGISIKFSADNSFVVVTDLGTKRHRTVQLAVPVLFEQGTYFVQRDEILTLFRSIADSSLRIVTTEAPVPDTVTVIPSITGFSLEEKKNGTLFRIHLSAKVKDFTRTLQTGEWIYVTLPGVQCDTLMFDTTFAEGVIRRVKPVQSETSLQLSFNLRGRMAQSEIVQDQLSNDILLTLIPPVSEEKKEAKIDSAAIRRQQSERAHQRVVNSIEKQKKKWKLDVVVIDPGHGGHDPGTIGIIGTREKDITLGIALKLGEMIKQEIPELKVVFTRKTDRFVELFRRGQIANESEGKIFVSIHCNSTERKPSSANGFEIYLLRPGKTEDAIRIAEKENDVVKLEKDFEDRYQELTEENFIILTMAQSAYVKQSERFAEMLEETMSAQMEGMRQPVKQAGFYVLVGASMPNVLVESGYLSNVKEERFLRSPAGQKKVATAIVNALKGYKNEYEDENQ